MRDFLRVYSPTSMDIGNSKWKRKEEMGRYVRQTTDKQNKTVNSQRI